MKKVLSLMMALAICMISSCAMAGNWSVPGPGPSPGPDKFGERSGARHAVAGVRTTVLEDDLATRSGPSKEYTGCGTLKNMNGKQAVALARAVDDGGICWVEIEVSYHYGAPRRCWVGFQRLSLTGQQLNQLPYDYEFALGEGIINQYVIPRMGPGTAYVANKDYSLTDGTPVAVVASEGDYYLVERRVYGTYENKYLILRCWVPAQCVTMQ